MFSFFSLNQNINYTNSIKANLENEYILELLNDVVSQIIDDTKLNWDTLSEEEKESIQGFYLIDGTIKLVIGNVRKNFY
jgi:hypothetical protein